MTWSPFDQPIRTEFDLSALPPGWTAGDTGKCRSCGTSIVWCSHDTTGRKAPYEADGRQHQPRCPHRGFHAQRAKDRAAAREAAR